MSYVLEHIESNALFFQFPGGRWAEMSRHPVSSWKAHYKKNQERLDPLIDKIVGETKLAARSRTAYEGDRGVNYAQPKDERRKAREAEGDREQRREVQRGQRPREGSGQDIEEPEKLVAELDDDANAEGQAHNKEFNDSSSVGLEDDLDDDDAAEGQTEHEREFNDSSSVNFEDLGPPDLPVVPAQSPPRPIVRRRQQVYVLVPPRRYV